MAMTATDRARCMAQVMRLASEDWVGMTKSDLLAAVDAVDDWCDANQASYNSSLPLIFRTNATAQQKSLLLCYVVMRRVGLLRAEEDG